MAEFTLCWDCKNSYTNGCSWARKLIPVKEWTAFHSKKKEFESYLVVNCPKFERDSWDAGKYRTKEEYVAALIKARRWDDVKNMEETE